MHDNIQADRLARKYSRRSVLRLALGVAGTGVLAACGGSTQQANTNGSTKTTGAKPTTSKNLGFENPNELTTPTPQTGGATQATQTGQATQPVQSASTPSGTTVTGGTTAVSGPPPTKAAEPTLPVPKSFNESPTLKQMADSGKLPKVADRVPQNPFVIKPVEATGTYGGTLALETTNPMGSGYEGRIMGYEQLVRWRVIKDDNDVKSFSYGLDDIIPNIAESYEIKNDGKEYVFHLRKGMKWSDGSPYSADDFVFMWEDVWMNKELSPGGPPSFMNIKDKTGKIEKIDDYTIVYKFPISHGLFLPTIAGPQGGASVGLPAKYLKQFHKKYNPDVVKEAKKKNLDDWTALFGLMNTWNSNKDLPVLFGWYMSLPIGADPQRWEASRNQYYWKVDNEGNQLPYLDKIVFKLVTKPETLLLNALNGEVDVVTDYVNELQNKPLFYKNQQKGDYRIYDLMSGESTRTVIALNLTTRDKVKNKVFNDINFRIGLSYAMNRQEIIDTVYQGQGEPYQVAPLPGTAFYNEKLAKQYTEHDVNKANQYLDKVLPKKDGNGNRLGPDGKPFFFQVEVASDYRPEWTDIMDLVEHHWAQVGIGMKTKAEKRDLLYTRKAGNEPDATVWEDTSAIGILLDPRWYFPSGGESNFAIPWANWYTNGGLLGKIPKKPDFPVEKPPAATIKQMKLFQQLSQTADQKKQVQLMKQVLDIAQQQFYAMGVTLPKAGYGTAKNNMQNVQNWMMWDWIYLSPAPFNTTTWSKKQT